MEGRRFSGLGWAEWNGNAGSGKDKGEEEHGCIVKRGEGGEEWGG